MEPYVYFSKIILVALWYMACREEEWKQGEPWDNPNEATACRPVPTSKLFTICNKISTEIDSKCLETLKHFKVIWHRYNIQPEISIFLQKYHVTLD